MAKQHGGMPVPKPEPKKRVKARAKRQEAAVVQDVRARCVERDGYCRIQSVFGDCRGPSEWAHFEEHRRFKTRGQAPEERHTTAGSLMLCQRHHDQYDDRQLELQPMSELGADSTIRVIRADGFFVLSVPPHVDY